VYISFHIVRNRNIIYKVIAVQVQVVDHGFLVIQALFKSFQGFRILEQIHHSIEVKIVSRQTKVFIGIALCRYSQGSCCKESQGIYGA
jgi:hypothetical protein